MEIDVRNKLASQKVQKMLANGQVIALLHPDTNKIVTAKTKDFHPNLSFMENEFVERGKIMFVEKSTIDNFHSSITDQLITK